MGQEVEPICKRRCPMQVTTPRSRLVLLLVGVLLFGGAAWLNGGPIGNAGHG
jgi:hypothetical protein